ncbi:MAG: hypothetical protein HYU56_00675 [Candidatus Aenigmarchaeota archaeon]|nr:hypothetical protein [Candidatus Aenigmarchaeota archaeon]
MMIGTALAWGCYDSNKAEKEKAVTTVSVDKPNKGYDTGHVSSSICRNDYPHLKPTEKEKHTYVAVDAKDLCAYETTFDRDVIAAIYSDGSKKKMQILKRSFGNEPGNVVIGYVEGNDFYFNDVDGDGVKEIIVKNGRGLTPEGNPTGPTRSIAVLSLRLQKIPETYFDTDTKDYYRDSPLKVIEDIKTKLVPAISHGDSRTIRQLQHNSDLLAFGIALNELLVESPNAESLYRELFGMEQRTFVDQMLVNPSSLNRYLRAEFAERLIHHMRLKDDHLIGYDAGKGYSVAFDNAVYRGFDSRREAIKHIQYLEKKKFEETK